MNTFFNVVVVCSIFSIPFVYAVDYRNYYKTIVSTCAPIAAALKLHNNHKRRASDEIKPPIDLGGILDPKSPNRR